MNSPIFFYYPREVSKSTGLHFNMDGLDHWVLETYLKLLEEFSDSHIQLVKNIPEEGIILFHKSFFPPGLRPTFKQYFVCIQVDRGRHDFAHYHIVHNPYQSYPFLFPNLIIDKIFSFTGSAFIEGWSINSIRPRLVERKQNILTLGYHGNPNNLPAEFSETQFQKFLDDRKLKFLKYYSPSDWNNFEEIDLSLCIRDFSGTKFYSKPYLKITNSLLAGVPVIGGMESSHSYFSKYYVKIPRAQSLNHLMNLLDEITSKRLDPFWQLQEFERFIKVFDDTGIKVKWLQILADIQSRYLIWRSNSNKKGQHTFFKIRSLLKSVKSF